MSEELSKREQQIADLYAGGWSNLEIAQVLGISTRTLEKHRQRITQKKSADGLAQLVGLLDREKIHRLQERITELEREVDALKRSAVKQDA